MLKKTANNENEMQARKGGKVPQHRWEHDEIKQFLQVIIEDIKDDISKFEKPSAARYYDRLKSKFPMTIQGLSFTHIKNKVNYLKGQYTKALNWKNSTGNGIDDGVDAETIQEYITHTCPFFEELDVIYSQKRNVNPSHIRDTEEGQLIERSETSEGSEGTENQEYTQEYVIEEIIQQEPEQLQCEQPNRRKKHNTTQGAAAVLLEMQDKRCEIEERRAVWQAEIEKEKLSIEKEKIGDEREQFKQELELRKQEISLQLAVKEKEYENTLSLRSLELAHQERLAVLKIESDERLKRFELELKFKNSNPN